MQLTRAHHSVKLEKQRVSLIVVMLSVQTQDYIDVFLYILSMQTLRNMEEYIWFSSMLSIGLMRSKLM